MCGIAGFSLTDEANQKVNSRRLAIDLLDRVEHRGHDATGAAWYDPNGVFTLQKKDITATKFRKDLSTHRRAPSAILHTRASTGGSPTNNLNNHPIKAGPVTGVHNGWLTWEDSQWSMLGVKDRRTAEVDSEVIFATIAWGLEVESDGKPRVKEAENVADLLATIEGKAAVAWFDERDQRTGDLHLSRGSMSPLVACYTEDGSVIFASEQQALEFSLLGTGLHVASFKEFEEGEYHVYNKGELMDVQSYEVADTFQSYDKRSATAFGTGAVSQSWAQSSGKRQNLRSLKSIAEGVDEMGRTFANTVLLPDDDENYDLCDWVDDLLDPSIPVEHESGDTLDPVRLSNIDEYVANRVLEVQDVGEAATEAYERGATVRLGQWVAISLSDQRVCGQIASMPEAFPGGWFTVRALVPLPLEGEIVCGGFASAHEAVIVRRRIRDVDPIPEKDAESIDTYYHNSVAPLPAIEGGK